MNDIKVYVSVMANFDELGKLNPTSMIWEDGASYEIDKIIDVRPAHAARAGGQGTRYTVKVCGQITYLYFEHSTKPIGNQIGKWFVERKRTG